MNTGFDGSMIDQLLETAEEKKEKEEDCRCETKIFEQSYESEEEEKNVTASSSSRG